MFKLVFTLTAEDNLLHLQNSPALRKHFKAVRKALGYLETNPRHPALNTHKYTGIKGPNDEEVFEAYAENNTPAAYRIFWYYGSNKQQITIVAITPHP